MNIDHMKNKAPEVAEILKILAHPKRLLLLCLLKEEMNVGEIQEACELSQSQTSQYLNDLERRGILTSRAQGKARFYQISDEKIKKLFLAWYDIYCVDPEN